VLPKNTNKVLFFKHKFWDGKKIVVKPLYIAGTAAEAFKTFP